VVFRDWLYEYPPDWRVNIYAATRLDEAKPPSQTWTLGANPIQIECIVDYVTQYELEPIAFPS
jgi:hypothetical protein